MKRLHPGLIGLLIFCLALVPLAGCVSKSEYEALQAKYTTLAEENTSLKAELERVQSDLTKVQADYEAASNELAHIKQVYPPRDFSSFEELRDWLLANDVSEQPPAKTLKAGYSKALEIQEDALKDGYKVSAGITYDPKTQKVLISCAAVADGWVWIWNPETDTPLNLLEVS